MKRISLFILGIVAFIVGCTNETLGDSSNVVDKIKTTSINKDDALIIANKVLSRNGKTRSDADSLPELDYVFSKNRTRNAWSGDTLAYIINYPNNGGFVIVSSIKNVYPVLGFSKEGNFSFDNAAAEQNFVECIEDYLANANKLSIYEVDDNDFDGCYVVDPMVQISLSQGNPWNKYVIKEHPNCPAGCVAVATALVMSHSKDSINYHGSLFKFKSITEAISKGQGYSNNSVVNTTISHKPVYSYEEAVDSMARLLYWLGKDLNMDYSVLGSGAYSIDAYNLCKDLGYEIPSNYASFDINKISWYLEDGYIIYIKGRDTEKDAGHAWVSDGCYFCVDKENSTIFNRGNIKETYIYCDWGWGGRCNGYYSGSVFAASSYKFKPLNYFAVKVEWKKGQYTVIK